MCAMDAAPEVSICVMLRCRSLLLVLAALFLACGDGEAPSGPTEPDRIPVPASMAVTPESARLAAFGQSVQLTARVHDQGDSP